MVGGTGFLGSHISEALQDQGFQVSVAGRESLAAVLESSYEAVVWAAGGRARTRAVLQEQHVLAPLRALESTKQCGRFVYLSSGEVYGPSKVPFTEATAPEGTTDYALAKLEGEARLGIAARERGLKLTCLRVALAYGEGQQGSMFVPSLLRHLLDRVPFAASPGAQTRDFLYATDVASATVLALTSDAPSGVFNVGSSKEITLKDMALRVQREFDDQSGRDSLELLRFGELPYRVNEQMRYLLSMDKTRSELGFAPKITLSEGIARLVATARQ